MWILNLIIIIMIDIETIIWINKLIFNLTIVYFITKNILKI